MEAARPPSALPLMRTPFARILPLAYARVKGLTLRGFFKQPRPF